MSTEPSLAFLQTYARLARLAPFCPLGSRVLEDRVRQTAVRPGRE